MKKAELLACCLLVFPLVGTVPRSVPKTRAQSLPLPEDTSARTKAFQSLMTQGGKLFLEGHYLEAQSRFEEARQTALAAGDPRKVLRALGNIGGCEFSLHRYQAALRSFVEARRTAESLGDVNDAAVLDANIAALYGQMGEIGAAAEWLQNSLARMSGDERRKFLPKLQLELASLRARQRRMDEARDLFRKGISGAERSGDPALYATGWSRLGEELLARHELAAAERALLESYRVRKLFHLVGIETSYWNLGKLRLEQGDLESAGALLDRAVEITAVPRGPLPEWQLYSVRGRVRLAQGRLEDALKDLRVALRLARAWRWSAPADDFSHMGSESVVLNRLYSDLVEAGNRLYLEHRDPALMRETFEAAEENRAASLRWLASGGAVQTGDLPAAYWEAIARLQRAEIAALRSGDEHTQDAVAAARAELVRLESSLIPGSATPSEGLLDRTRAALDSDTVLLSFDLGESDSWLWAVDRAGLALFRLPAKREIESQAAAAIEAIRGDPQSSAASAKVYATLFGPLPRRFREKTRWLLALDDALLNVPVAALLEESRPRPVYVAERHITEVIPGAGYWVDSAARKRGPEVSPLFVGIGDPIYNRADERRVRPRPVAGWASFGPQPVSAAGQSSALFLPRLVGSGAEVENCAAVWKGRHVLLEGADASRAKLREQLDRNPAVLHFATHVVGSSETERYGMIALSLNEHQETELLQPLEIARWRIHAGLVVLSGCHSAAGTRPWTGLVGLTRAWLTAGAGSVMASRWDTPDESGALFRAFYYNLGSQSQTDAGRALRAAQVEMIRASDWRAQPRYWGAYFVVGSQ